MLDSPANKSGDSNGWILLKVKRAAVDMGRWKPNFQPSTLSHITPIRILMGEVSSVVERAQQLIYDDLNIVGETERIKLKIGTLESGQGYGTESCHLIGTLEKHSGMDGYFFYFLLIPACSFDFV